MGNKLDALKLLLSRVFSNDLVTLNIESLLLQL
jgi:hypothetical protein